MNACKFVRQVSSAICVLIAVLAAGTHAYGQVCSPGYPASVRAYDSREVAMLPRYCVNTQDFREKIAGANNPEEIKRWTSVMGEVFNAMHHYCWALMATNRGTLQPCTKEVRGSLLGSALDDIDYVVKRSPKDFVLLPEIYTKKGDILIRLGKVSEGLTELQRAVEAKPDYWPPYATMSDYYKNTGDLKKARELLEKGLEASPDARALKTRLGEIETVKVKPKTAPQPAKKAVETKSDPGT